MNRAWKHVAACRAAGCLIASRVAALIAARAPNQQLQAENITVSETVFQMPFRVFHGSFSERLTPSVFYRHGMLLTDTECRFTDSSEGEAEGNVLLAYPLGYSNARASL